MAAAAASPPPTPDLEWHLIIEELADLPGVKTALLRGFIDEVPDFATAGPEQVRERVAVRVLEEFVGADPGDAAMPPGAVGSLINASQSVEAVLSLYAKMVATLSGAEKDSFGRLNTEIRNFILHKRSMMPKTSLCLLKEYIEDENCTPFSSLRQHIAWTRLNQEDHADCNAGGEHERVTTQISSMNGAENPLHEQGSAACTVDNGPQTLQKEPSGTVLKDVIDIQNIMVQELVKVPIPEPPGRENINVDDHETQSIAQNATASTAPAADDCNTISHNGLSGAMHLPGQNILKDTAMSEQLHKSNSLPNLPLHNGGHDGKDDLHGRTNIVLEKTSGDVSDDVSSEFESLGRVVANEKKHLSSSQVQVNCDSVAGDWAKQGLCIKCDKGGQVFSCSASGCVISVHESCLGQTIKFDETGCFYCPFCANKTAFKAYSIARKHYLQTIKTLSAFLGKDIVEGLCKKTSTQKCQLRAVDDSMHHLAGSVLDREHNQEIEAASICDNHKQPTTMEVASVAGCDPPNNMAKVIEEKIGGVTAAEHSPVDVNEHLLPAEHSQPAEPHEATNGGSLSHDEGGNDGNLSHEERNGSGKESGGFLVQQEGGMSPCDGRPTSQQPKSHEHVKATSNIAADGQSLSSQENERKHKRKQDTRGINPPKETSETHNSFKSSPTKKRKHGHRHKRYANPVLPPGRRTKLPWTKEEEEVLKKGVEVMGLNPDGSRPWRRILEFGQGVFHKTRLQVDLKDKWRNLAKHLDKDS